MQVVPHDKPQVAQVVAVGGGAQALDAAAFSNLANVTSLQLKQGNVFWEAATGGCVPNTYIVKTRDPEHPENDVNGIPIFIMEEQSSCFCRACCSPFQPLFVKFYNVQNPPQAVPKSGCCCCAKPAGFRYNKMPGAVMTLERHGCTDKCCTSDVCICMACCQSEMFLHAGEVGQPDGSDAGKLDKSTAFGHSIVPIMGGGITPTVNVMARTSDGQEAQFGVVEGPTCFGGCADLCCSTPFTVSKEKGKAGDLAIIQKRARDPGCGGLCAALCSPADTYNIDFTDMNLTPQQKAQVIGEAVHLDFLFFEREQPLCRVNESNNCLEILFCNCYCIGCLCPIKLCIPLNGGK